MRDEEVANLIYTGLWNYVGYDRQRLRRAISDAESALEY